jgi:hypothetical protein
VRWFTIADHNREPPVHEPEERTSRNKALDFITHVEGMRQRASR